MPLYVVSCDLNRHKDYPKLWAEMRRLGAHKPLESVYFLNVDSKDSGDLLTHLRTFVDEDDQMIVVEFSKRPATRKAKAGTADWLDKNL